MDNLSPNDIQTKIDALEIQIEIENHKLDMINTEDEMEKKKIQSKITDWSLKKQRKLDQISENSNALSYMFINRVLK